MTLRNYSKGILGQVKSLGVPIVEADPVRHRGISGGSEVALNKVRGMDLHAGSAFDQDQLAAPFFV